MNKLISLVFVVLSLTACSGIPVSTDYDTSHVFSNVKHYAWLEPKQKLIIDPYVDNDLINQRFHRAIDAELAKRGMQRVDDLKAADILVSYHLSSSEKISAVNYHAAFGYYPCRGCWNTGVMMGPESVSVNQYREGSFIIDFIAPESRKLVWRGVAERRLPGNATPPERDVYVNEVVTAIINKFPPQ